MVAASLAGWETKGDYWAIVAVRARDVVVIEFA